jgi:hypothetical protein
MIINNIKRFTNIITSNGVKMRKPFNNNGEWIGWTKQEVITYLSSFKDQKPLKEKFLALKEKLYKKES